MFTSLINAISHKDMLHKLKFTINDLIEDSVRMFIHNVKTKFKKK